MFCLCATREKAVKKRGFATTASQVATIEALIIRIGFWGIVYYNSNKGTPQ